MWSQGLTRGEGSVSTEPKLWDPSERGGFGDRKEIQFRIQQDGRVKLQSPKWTLLSARVERG